MATRSIITSRPDVICDVCGRRLLRGEQIEVFLADGHRRNVCQLCAPRALDGGWLRESEHERVSAPAARQRRGRNLIERLRQLREAPRAAQRPDAPVHGQDAAGDASELVNGELSALASHRGHAGGADEGAERATARPVPAMPLAEGPGSGGRASAHAASSGVQLKAQRALEVFNAGEHPRRVGGIARALGAPNVSVYRCAESESRFAIVIAWELCWYRYEVDLADEQAGASVVAQGSELSELSDEKALANATSSEDGTLSLLASMLR